MSVASLEPFVSSLDDASQVNTQDDPNYYAREPQSLITTSNVHSYMNGTGSALYRSLSPLIESTNQELILVTCFWARSSSLDVLGDILCKLSDKATRRGTDKIKVRLCFSSLSLFQKLFHTQSVTGQTYPKELWTKKLGLPDPSKLGGLDLQIKSIFILPFSVMHPKFMIIDRSTVILPSCNISWEEWFEGAVTISGPIVSHFLQFYHSFWARSTDFPSAQEVHRDQEKFWTTQTGPFIDLGNSHVIVNFPKTGDQSSISNIPTVFLPSPHRRHPRFKPFASSDKITAPPTPLNTFILTLITKAERSIRIQTPNITSPPILSSLLKALERGIDVQILTSQKLMILEQLVTAGTTTSRCIKTLIKRYLKLHPSSSKSKRPSSTDEEAAISSPPSPGRLRISYFEPLNGARKRGNEEGEPQQSHLKLMIVDDEVVVLGSGNLDRASWFTSQELGVAFFDRGFVERTRVVLDEAIRGRSRVVFDSGLEGV